MKRAKNEGSSQCYNEICVPCELNNIIPIFPVRYALGQFDYELKDLAYPSLIDLYQNKGEPQKGMVTRFLRSGWIFVYTEEGANCKADKKHPDAAASHDGDWHIYYYYSPDDGGDIGGSFVKYKWSGGSADKGEWLPYVNDNNQLVKRSYIFVAPSISKISIAYSQHIWSLDMFNILKQGTKADRGKYMQLVSVFPTQVEKEVAPLQLFNDIRPTKAQIKTLSEDKLTFSPSSFVSEFLNFPEQETTGPKADDKKESGEQFSLSGVPLTQYSKTKVTQLRNQMRKKAEVGIVVALHDPVGISSDLGGFHNSINLDALHDVMENRYAYTMYQKVELLLGKVLPESKSPFAMSRHSKQLVIDDFNKKVKTEMAQSMGLRSDAEWANRIAESNVYRQMNIIKQERLKEAQVDLKTQNKQVEHLDKAMLALGPDFSRIRKEIAEKALLREKNLVDLLVTAQQWISKTGPGSINNYLELLSLGSQSSVISDQIGAVHHLTSVIATLLKGFESSRPGRKLIAKTVFAKEGYWMMHILPFTAKGTDWSTTLINKYAESIEKRHGQNINRMHTLHAGINDIFDRISGTNALSDSMLTTIHKPNALADPLKAAATLKTLSRLNNINFSVAIETVDEILENLSQNTQEIQKWNSSLRKKIFGAISGQPLSVIYIDSAPVDYKTDFVNNRLNVITGGIELGLMAIDFQMKSQQFKKIIKKQESSNFIGAAEALKGNMLYMAATLADNAAKFVAKDINKVISASSASLVRVAGHNSAVLSSTIKTGIEAKVGASKYLKIAKFADDFAKVGPAVGFVDMISNACLAFGLTDEGDYDAAAYAATGALGGAAMIWATVAVGTGGMALFATGLALSIGSMLGLANAKDNDIEAWIRDGFWGGASSKFIGLVPEYKFWGEVERNKIRIQKESDTAFESQLEIAKIIDDGDAIAIKPIADKSKLAQYFKDELNAYNNLVYMPRIAKEGDFYKIYLPHFTHGISAIQLKHVIADSTSNKRLDINAVNTENDLSYPDNEQHWFVTAIPNTFLLKLPPIKASGWLNKGYLEFTYLPLGVCDISITIPAKNKGTLLSKARYEL